METFLFLFVSVVLIVVALSIFSTLAKKSREKAVNNSLRTQKNESGFSDAKKFVEDKCLGKTVYLDIDNAQPKDKYERTLAIVYTDSEDINKALIENKLAEISYFEPSEFKKGEI